MIIDICIMYVLLASATSAEIQITADFLGKTAYNTGTHEVKLLVTGVGAVTTTYSLTKAIHSLRPAIVIQAGIAGTFGTKLPGQLVTVDEELFADLGVWENNRFKDIFDLGLADGSKLPFSKNVLKNPYRQLINLAGLDPVRGITVNEITTDTDRINWYQQNLNPVVESMEGAALHYVCLQENIPFLQIRAVSNFIGVRNKSEWKIKESVLNLNDKIISLLNDLSAYDETYFRI